MGEPNKISSDFNSESLRIKYLILPRSLYDSYFQFYQLAKIAARQAEDTLLDGVHQRAMVTGRRHFTNMPDEELFIQRIYQMQDRLKEHKAYMRYACIRTPRGQSEPHEYVYLTPKQALEFDSLVIDSMKLFNDTIIGVWQTDYMRNMTRLKNEGRPYDGLTCLQEIFDMAIGIIRVQHVTKELAKKGMLHPDWKALIKAPQY